MPGEPEKSGVPYAVSLAGWWLPILAAVATAAWTVYLYAAGQAEKANTALLQAQQPFLTAQLNLYSEVLGVVGKLVTLPRNDGEWAKSEVRFWQLYWSELSLVESADVEQGMVRLANQLNTYKKDGSNLAALETCAYELAHDVRRSMQDRWQVAKSDKIERNCPQPQGKVTRWRPDG